MNSTTQIFYHHDVAHFVVARFSVLRRVLLRSLLITAILIPFALIAAWALGDPGARDLARAGFGFICVWLFVVIYQIALHSSVRSVSISNGKVTIDYVSSSVPIDEDGVANLVRVGEFMRVNITWRDASQKATITSAINFEEMRRALESCGVLVKIN